MANALEISVLNNRIQWVDWMKTIGMFLIVWGHFFPPHVSKYIYAINVPIFFFISGYLSKPLDSIRLWLKKQWQSLILPYLLLCSLNLVVFYISHLYLFSWVNVLKSIVLVLLGWHSYNDIPGCSELWFVYVLVIVRLLYQVLNKHKLIHGFIALLLYVFAGFYGKMSHWGLDLWSVQSLPLAYPIFYLGNCVKSTRFNLNYDINKWVYLTIFIISTILFYLVVRRHNMALIFIADYGTSYLRYTAGAVLGIAMIYCFCRLIVLIYSNIYIYIRREH